MRGLGLLQHCHAGERECGSHDLLQQHRVSAFSNINGGAMARGLDGPGWDSDDFLTSGNGGLDLSRLTTRGRWRPQTPSIIITVNGSIFYFFIFWICNARRALRVLIFDYVVMRDAWTVHLRLHCNARCEVGDTRRTRLLSTFGHVSDDPFLRSMMVAGGINAV
jgi:hypothetical protein